MAEAEIESEDFNLVMPDWCEKEVTGLLDYTNIALQEKEKDETPN